MALHTNVCFVYMFSLYSTTIKKRISTSVWVTSLAASRMTILKKRKSWKKKKVEERRKQNSTFYAVSFPAYCCCWWCWKRHIFPSCTSRPLRKKIIFFSCGSCYACSHRLDMVRSRKNMRNKSIYKNRRTHTHTQEQGEKKLIRQLTKRT